MPATTILYPNGLFATNRRDHIDKANFRTEAKGVVAREMDARNPITGEMTHYGDDPDKFIDLFLVPYEPDDAEVTAVCVATIVTYDWPDRMRNLPDRIERITHHIRGLIPDALVPEGMDGISFTFLGKQLGCWFAA